MSAKDSGPCLSFPETVELESVLQSMGLFHTHTDCSDNLSESHHTQTDGSCEYSTCCHSVSHSKEGEEPPTLTDCPIAVGASCCPAFFMRTVQSDSMLFALAALGVFMGISWAARKTPLLSTDHNIKSNATTQLSIRDITEDAKRICMPLARAHVEPLMRAASSVCLETRKGQGCSILFAHGHHNELLYGEKTSQCMQLIPSMLDEAIGVHLADSNHSSPGLQLDSLCVYGQILHGTNPMLRFLQDMRETGRAEDASAWPLASFITSLQKSCVQLRRATSKARRLLLHALGDNNPGISPQVVLEDMLVPHRLCKEMLPSENDIGTAEYSDESASSDAGSVAQSVVRGVSRATLGSMLQFRQIAFDVLKGALVHSEHSDCLREAAYGERQGYNVIFASGLLNTPHEGAVVTGKGDQEESTMLNMADNLRYFEGLLARRGTDSIIVLHRALDAAVERFLVQYSAQKKDLELEILHLGDKKEETSSAREHVVHAYYFIRKKTVHNKENDWMTTYLGEWLAGWHS